MNRNNRPVSSQRGEGEALAAMCLHGWLQSELCCVIVRRVLEAALFRFAVTESAELSAFQHGEMRQQTLSVCQPLVQFRFQNSSSGQPP